MAFARFSLSDSSLKDVLGTVERFCKTNNIDSSICMKLRLVFEELVVNVFSHAVKMGADTLEIDFGVVNNKVVVRVEYNGGEFDPTTFRASVDDVSLDERKEGGLGLFLVSNFSDRFEYKRENDFNKLIVEIG